jgi:hypothetical protein
MTRPAVITLVVALILTNLAWGYALLDRSVTQTYQTDELERQERLNTVLRELAVELPRDEGPEAAVAFLKQKYPTLLVKRDGDVVEFSDLMLQYRGRSLSEIRPF